MELERYTCRPFCGMPKLVAKDSAGPKYVINIEDYGNFTVKATLCPISYSHLSYYRPNWYLVYDAAKAPNGFTPTELLQEIMRDKEQELLDAHLHCSFVSMLQIINPKEENQ